MHKHLGQYLLAPRAVPTKKMVKKKSGATREQCTSQPCIRAKEKGNLIHVLWSNGERSGEPEDVMRDDVPEEVEALYATLLLQLLYQP